MRLLLNDNSLTGSIPSGLGNLTKLEDLSLANNSLTGSIPPELGNLSDLDTLGLYGNGLSGCVPRSLSRFVAIGNINKQDNGVTLALCADDDPALSSSNITQATATLTLSGHTGDWHYQRTATGPVSACTPAVTGAQRLRTTTVSLSGLSADTTYMYKAYSDSACKSEIARETFTTLPAPITTPPPAPNPGDGTSGGGTSGGGTSAAALSAGAAPPAGSGGGSAPASSGGSEPTAEPDPDSDPALGDSFDDSTGSVFEESIRKVAEAGITNGCNSAGTLFCPNTTVTRAQMAVFLLRGLKLPVPSGATGFTDSAGFAQAAIDAMAAAGITMGCNADGTLFCPNKPVTRGQMAAFLARALKLPTPDVPAAFDDTANSVFNNAIAAILEAGITRGCDSTGKRFCPDKPVTRAQMATFLARALDL